MPNARDELRNTIALCCIGVEELEEAVGVGRYRDRVEPRGMGSSTYTFGYTRQSASCETTVRACEQRYSSYKLDWEVVHGSKRSLVRRTGARLVGLPTEIYFQ